ncbi:MAG: beta-propeller fold lactonase family protein [Candidatus Pacebacteria bacterium]|jgi:DNA-binding beta-propeller fold protein YncE|nr:beta-propeller fold lactonase family protein [Candidatus Paceibacterota bacterium]
MSIFHHSAAWIAKHKYHHHVFFGSLAFVFASLGVYVYTNDVARAATYNFVQATWVGGVTANTATHTSNQTGWTQYSADSGTILSDINGVSLQPTHHTLPDTGFVGGTHVSTTVSGSGAGATVSMIPVGVLSTLGAGTITAGNRSQGVAVAPEGTAVYVANYGDGTVSQYSRNTSTGALTFLGAVGGLNTPVAVVVSSDGASVYVANYGGNSVTVFARNIAAGTLTSLGAVAAGTGPSGINISADGKSVYVTHSFGSANNTVQQFSRNLSNGTLTALTPASVATGVNPQAVAVSPDGNHVYVSNTTSSYIDEFARNTTTGALTSIGTVVSGNNGFSIVVSPDGNHVYSSHYGTIYQYARNPSTGILTALVPGTVAVGAASKGIAISPDGNSVYSANSTANTVSQLSRNPATGQLTALNPGTVLTGTTPTWVAVSPDGNSVYAANNFNGTNVLSMYTRSNSSTGVFTSRVIDTGAAVAFTTLAYTATLNGETITLDARAGNTATPDGTWTAWQQGIASGGTIAGLAGNRYIQYRANFTTTTSALPVLNSVTISYDTYATTANLTSSIYDTESSGNVFSNVFWTASNTSGTESVRFQIRSSPDGATWTGWCGVANTCNGSDYFTVFSGVVGGISVGHPLITGGDDRYMQYKVSFTSSGVATPFLTSATLQYIVNGPPVVSNVVASQASDGYVTVTYDVSDADNTIGNTVDVTLQYCTTSCASGTEVWADAVSVTGGVGTGTPLGTGKSITWNPTIDYPSQFKEGVQKVRVKADDRATSNNIAYGTSGAFTLSTIQPAVTVSINSAGTQDVVTITATSVFTLEYRLCNASDFTGCATWTPITSGVATPANWSATGTPNAETVYLQVRDQYGNTTSRTIVAPAMPTSLLAADVSNPSAGSFGETVSWTVVPNAVSYRVYSGTSLDVSTPPSSYSLLASPVANMYNHNITTATTSAYWYRVAAVNTNGDVSNFTTAMTNGDVPDSFGTSVADTTAPASSSITAPTDNIRNTSAAVAFTTNELATAEVLYGTTHAASCNYAGTPVSTPYYVTSQSVNLTGLTSDTTYYFCVRTTDVLGNVSAWVDGGSFTTLGGPVITAVADTNTNDNSTTIFWNTSTSSDSYVYYSTSPSLANPQVSGSSAMVAESATPGIFQHQVGLSGLTAGTTYYYSVKSTDSLGNITTDTKGGVYYDFVTTVDTTAPAITNITTPVKSSTAVVIVWETDEPATSQVLYGSTTGDRSRFLTTDATKSIYHVTTLSSATTNSGAAGGTNALSPSTTYYYVVKSADTAGNTATSAEQTVTTSEAGAVTIVTVVSGGGGGGGVAGDATPPVIAGVKVSEVTPFGATVTFETNEQVVSFVEYGKDTAYGDSAGSSSYANNHTVKLRGLTMGTDYHIRVKAVDRAGNMSTSADQTFKTSFISENLKDFANIDNIEAFQKEIENAIESILPSLVPPFVAKPQITNITEDGATVIFSTNIKAYPIVAFVEDSLYDATKENPYTSEISDTEKKENNHKIVITGLKQNTKYHLDARAFSLPKVIGKAGDVTFVTQAAKIQGSIAERKKDSFTVVWATEGKTTSIVEFKNTKTGITDRRTDSAKATSHSMRIENLPSGTTFEVSISGVNEQGNTVVAGAPLMVTTSRDTTAPVISGFKVDNALVPGRTDRIQTIVSWTTDEPANATVYYEEGTGPQDDTEELANKNEALDAYVVNHSVILPNLKPGTIYRIKVTSGDDSGNKGSFGPRTIITPRQTESITDIIFKNFEDSFKFLRKI